MSVTFVLVPALIGAIAAAASGGAATVGIGATVAGLVRGGKGAPVQVQTRMKDVGLLQGALSDCGATNLTMTDGMLVATLGDTQLTMSRGDDGIWTAHFEALRGGEVDEEAMLEIVQDLDAKYALRVQAAVADRIRERAGSAGLDLVQESRDDDETVTMLLTVRDEV